MVCIEGNRLCVGVSSFACEVNLLGQGHPNCAWQSGQTGKAGKAGKAGKVYHLTSTQVADVMRKMTQAVTLTGCSSYSPVANFSAQGGKGTCPSTHMLFLWYSIFFFSSVSFNRLNFFSFFCPF